MLEDTFESMEDGEEMEEAAEEEVDKILFEITAGEEFGFFNEWQHCYISIFVYLTVYWNQRLNYNTDWL